jgi:CRISPR-associated endonuclease/helicase Cas3
MDRSVIKYPWAKLDKKTGDTHYLIHHLMDVAAVFEALCVLPMYQKILNKSAGREVDRYDLQRLSVMVFLHDVGKLRPEFQAKMFGPTDAKHAKEGFGIIPQAARDRAHPLHSLLRTLGEKCGGLQTTEIFRHIFSHHGTPVDFSMIAWKYHKGLDYDWKKHARDLDIFIRRWFPAAFRNFRELPKSEEFYHLINGLTALSDHIGSNKDFFPFSPKPTEDYGRFSRNNARRVLRHIGLNTGRFKIKGTDTETLSGYPTLNPAQEAMLSIPLKQKRVVLESETGSGKTEAAIIRFALLFAAGEVSGMYFAVPTRSAAKQLHHRLIKAMKRIFGEKVGFFPEVVLALPGYIKSGEATGTSLPGFQTSWDDKKKDTSRWAAEQSTRYLASTIAVGTVDQAMMAGLLVKHAHMRGSALSKSLLVIDEVHASDEYMTKLIKFTVDNQNKMDGHVLLMSATLGSVARSKWLDRQLPNLDQAIDEVYPAIWTNEYHPTSVRNIENQKTIIMRDLPIMGMSDEIAELAISQAQKGARVLVIRNTVSECQGVFDEIMAVDPSLLMSVNGVPSCHHSRYFVEDRELLDKTVEETLINDPDRPIIGTIVVGTQTVEQSLDIDADYLITDLCPMDVLLQRIGRLARNKDIKRPSGYDDHTCCVITPKFGLNHLAKTGYENGLGAWTTKEGNTNGIYYDLVGISIVQEMIKNQPVWTIPAMNRMLVESSTHPDSKARFLNAKPEEQQKVWRSYSQLIHEKITLERTASEIVGLDRSSRLKNGYPDAAKTRLGDIGATLSISFQGPFGKQVKTITLPEHLSYDIKDQPENISVEEMPDIPDAKLITIQSDPTSLTENIITHFQYDSRGLTKVTILDNDDPEL